MSHDSASSARSTVSDWIDSLKRGSTDATRKIWERFVERLVRKANQRLKTLPSRAVGGDDIAQEAFDAFFRGVKANRFSKLDDRNDLWQLLIMLADRRAIDHMRKVLPPQDGPGVVNVSDVRPPADRSGSSGVGLENLAAPPVTPESVEALIRLIQRTFPELKDDELRQIVLDRAENYSVEEIARRHGKGLRTTERKLELIRLLIERSARKGT